uniref:Uncharacterized protein n=1 Tax=Entomoneis paludosa TaxID=265537 RepID=A0A7S2YLW9_9STRA|mmetsp:Transcript_38143/g.79315  ORF Transcript_38143/g.79315 Transcript_38143/m.79315 type:complete len:236 (+) Transcript_38143:364-1071(+)
MTSSPVVGTVSSFVTSRGQAVVSPTQQDESSSAPQGFQLFGKTGSYAAIVSSPNLAFVKTNEPSSGAKKPGMGTGRNQASPTAVVSQVDLLRRTSKSVGSTAKATFPVVIDSSATTPPLFGPATDAVAAAEAAAIQAKADRPKKVRARQTKAKKVKQYIPIAPALSLRNDKKRSTQSSSSVKEQFLQVVALHSSASSSSSSHKRAKTVAVNINDMSPPEQVQFRKERNCVLAKKT